MFVRHPGGFQSVFVGPWTSAGEASWKEGAEILWIKFSLGTFIPQLPTRDFQVVETILPGAANESIWLNGSADHENEARRVSQGNGLNVEQQGDLPSNLARPARLA